MQPQEKQEWIDTVQQELILLKIVKNIFADIANAIDEVADEITLEEVNNTDLSTINMQNTHNIINNTINNG
ncbi:hypothetical protein B4088_2733 [Bacillus cereus]|uniref:Uncharacterized protein n=1 Tax=Bacillus cereus TaxID=1396 RepID=A0A161T5E1_BACCE|nr:hypothetical protein B4088_2733 [Bacillus cereus]